MKILAFDPSGNHPSDKEGSGTTGVAIYTDGHIELRELKADDYPTTEAYFLAHKDLIQQEFPDYLVYEGYRLYNHRGQGAQKQTHSIMPTSQLIGVIRLTAFEFVIPTKMQMAADVKTRWSDTVLQHLGILEGSLFNGQKTNAHKRDALRHLMHFTKYNLAKMGETQ